MTTAEASALPYLIFRLGGYHYGLSIDYVVEVAAMVEVVPLAGGTPALMGVANRHGSILPMLDMRVIFGQSAAQIDTTTLFVVVQHNTIMAGLVVDEIQQIVYLSARPHAHDSVQYIEGVLTQQEQIVQLVALPQVLKAHIPHQVLENGA